MARRDNSPHSDHAYNVGEGSSKHFDRQIVAVMASHHCGKLSEPSCMHVLGHVHSVQSHRKQQGHPPPPPPRGRAGLPKRVLQESLALCTEELNHIIRIQSLSSPGCMLEHQGWARRAMQLFDLTYSRRNLDAAGQQHSTAWYTVSSSSDSSAAT